MRSYLVKLSVLGYHITLIGLFITYVPLAGNETLKTESGISMSDEKSMMQSEVTSVHQHVIKRVLDNGLNILIRESHEIPKVSFQIWYNVGSKDELTGEKGIAHLIEHMIFKGTNTLSESDINVLVHKLSGSCNAFTSYDYTGYLFNFPTHHWREAFPVVADCMTNCLFNDDMLNSEMKAVIQELKLYKDQYERSLMEEMIGMIFADHPYHFPIIGYKQDLWSVAGKDLLSFYKKHYKPNNATLVIVGDVNADEVVELANQYFGSIPKDPTYVKKENFFHRDIASKSLTIYRDVAQPTLAYAFLVPGSIAKKDTAIDIFEWILGKGKSSRLYKKLVNNSQLATSVSTGNYNLFDYGVFFIMVEPKDLEDAPEIERIILEELDDLVKNGIDADEFERGYKKTQMAFYSLLEAIEDQAYAIGHTYLATGDENYVFTALEQPEELLHQQIRNIIVLCFRPTVMHKGFVLPLPQSEKKEWELLQEESDREDEKILAARERTTVVEPAVYANTIAIQLPTQFHFPKPATMILSNGLKVLYHNNDMTPKINIILEFKARSHFDPQDKQGLYTFVADMMTEGTKNYTSEELADAIESRGMSLNVYPGGIALKMLHSDFIFGLELLKEILINATFPEDEIEKVRDQLLTDIKQYWDEPRSFVSDLVRKALYKGHPYSKQSIGTESTISSITRQDLIDFYKQYISPSGAHIAIVGDLEGYDLQDILETVIGDWQGPVVKDIHYPQLSPAEQQEINYPINRDQVVLCLAQLSIDRKHPDYDKYLLFDQIFGGGVLGSMSSRLFDLREQTGLFYTIRGSLVAGADEQPGMFQVRTIVSLDRLAEAEKVIKETIDTVIDTLTEEELEEAKRAVVNTLVDNFVSNSDIANTFLYIDRFKFPVDYFDKRAAQVEKITLDDMKQAVKNILLSDKIITVRAGRV
ncbi:MAG TPA: pitrilysin family protein [Candidatus Babeliales bacterium]|jgi:zinc protease|nr:pitrilysin family protein [Candidatus Babeliales bacterium]